MRVTRTMAAATTLLVLALMGYPAAQAGHGWWPAQKGEVCLANDTTGKIAKLVVIRTMGNNYLVQGVTLTEEGYQDALINGNALSDEDGENIFVNVSFSGRDGDEVHGGVGHAILDLDAGGGTIKMINFHCEGEGPDGCFFSNDGTQDLSFVDCDGE